MLVVEAEMVALAILEGLLVTPDQSTEADISAEEDIVADAIVLGLLCTLLQSMLVVDADIVALAIVEGLLVTPLQSTDAETFADVDVVELADTFA